MGVVLFMLISAVVGGRLMLLHVRLRQLPELFLGLAYLAAGTFGFGGLLVGAIMAGPGGSVAESYQAFHVAFADAGTLCFYLFVWYVFRRDSAVAKALVAGAFLAMLVPLVRDTLLLGVTFGPPPGSPTTIAGSVARASVFPWMAFEALSSYRAFRKRARIGLGNPLVQNRLLLWGLSALAMFGISATSTSLYWLADGIVDATRKQDQAQNVYLLFAVLSSAALWLAFFPPKAYQRWVEASAQEPGHGG